MSAPNKPSQTHVAEASAWIAHLHGTRRTPDSDRGLQMWLKDDPARARALEAANEVWEEVGDLQGAAITRSLDSLRMARHRKQHIGLAIAASVLLAAMAALWIFRDTGVASRIGEQRALVLEDGSRVLLNTASRVIIRYDRRTRKVELKNGEARFDVAKNSDRPFIVSAGDKQVEALGTAFLVRRDDDRTTVTLIDGKVAVDSVSASAASPRSRSELAAAVLAPGERLTFVPGRPAELDRPPLEKLTAWERGEVIMEGMRLADAVAEMNRYSEVTLTVRDPRIANLVISGVFQAGDSLHFANAIADTYRLKAITDKREILIEGDPQIAY